ncbi:GH25 family lysozyme [Priestia koreensis]|uniref:GH25 family lysozyme n=1 Tax=Priestia koreensis TaxID=284581 RepID=UPI00301A0EDE
MGKIVDLSYYQGTIDFARASKEIDLAIIRVQYGAQTVDKRYKEYVEGCKKYNIPFGHYEYARYKTIGSAIQEARLFMERADSAAKFLVVDVEEMTLTRPSEIIPATQAFILACKQKGWKVGLYTGHSFYKEYNMGQIEADFLWIPRYSGSDRGIPHTNRPDMPCDLWQYTQAGRVAGISGNVDLNVLNGPLPLSWFTTKGQPIKTEQSSAPSNTTKTPGGRVMKLSDNQWKELATIYKTAYDKKILSSDEWVKKAQTKKLTVDEAIFLNTVLVGRTL